MECSGFVYGSDPYMEGNNLQDCRASAFLQHRDNDTQLLKMAGISPSETSLSASHSGCDAEEKLC